MKAKYSIENVLKKCFYTFEIIFRQYSTLKTPHIDMDVRKEVSTLQRKPMKQLSLDKVNNPG